MLSGVLNSPRAVQVNIEIMRAFVRYRHLIVAQGDLAAKLAEIEKQLSGRLDQHDDKFRMLTTAVRMLRDETKQSPPVPEPTSPAKKPSRRMGFNREET